MLNKKWNLKTKKYSNDWCAILYITVCCYWHSKLIIHQLQTIITNSLKSMHREIAFLLFTQVTVMYWEVLPRLHYFTVVRLKNLSNTMLQLFKDLFRRTVNNHLRWNIDMTRRRSFKLNMFHLQEKYLDNFFFKCTWQVMDSNAPDIKWKVESKCKGTWWTLSYLHTRSYASLEEPLIGNIFFIGLFHRSRWTNSKYKEHQYEQHKALDSFQKYRPISTSNLTPRYKNLI